MLLESLASSVVVNQAPSALAHLQAVSRLPESEIQSMRIVVVGTSGAGKTTMAKSLAVKLDLPCVELDRVHWQPNWEALTETDPAEFVRRVNAAITADSWVCDGNYSIVRDLIWRRATHLVWLDYGRWLIMYRVLKRSIARAFDQRELWAGNKEDWRHWMRPSHPIRWAWSTWKERRLRFEHLLDAVEYSHLIVLRLRTPREARSVVDRLKAPPNVHR
jgi:adenylate kinase family enzyme